MREAVITAVGLERRLAATFPELFNAQSALLAAHATATDAIPSAA
jgi:hypothetical protein